MCERHLRGDEGLECLGMNLQHEGAKCGGEGSSLRDPRDAEFGAGRFGFGWSSGGDGSRDGAGLRFRGER